MTRRPHALDLSMVLVVDLEATCWEGQPPHGESPEVIEIGMAHLTPHGIRRVQPTLNVRSEKSRVSDFCTRLTGRTQADVDKGQPLGRLTKQLIRSGTRRYVWASWGAFDLRHLRDECDLKGVWYPFSQSHINIKELHALHHRLSKPLGLDRALCMEGLEFEGVAHRGVDDAFNAARLLAKLLRWPRTGNPKALPPTRPGTSSASLGAPDSYEQDVTDEAG